SDFTWEVKANDRAYHRQFKKKVFLCWNRRKYADNAIKTSKYNILTFLPLNLYEQFHRTANLYFLFVILLQTIPEIATLPWFALLLPLGCLLIIRGARDLMDDIARHRSDRMINGRSCEILLGKRTLGSFSHLRNISTYGGRRRKKLSDKEGGHLVKVPKGKLQLLELRTLCKPCRAINMPRPAGMVAIPSVLGQTHELFPSLSSKQSRTLGISFQNTKHSFLEHLVDSFRLSRMPVVPLIGHLWVSFLDSFGLLQTVENAYGFPFLESLTLLKNSCGLSFRLGFLFFIKIFLMLVVISFCMAVAYGFLVVDFQSKHSYLSAFYSKSSVANEAFLIFWGFMILLSIIVPMSLYITFEFIYLVNSCFINWDLEMYYPPRNMPANARSTSLNDQLGQIEYIFSDKTGTLTQNIMTFKKCCINGLTYGPLKHGFWNKYADGNMVFYDSKLLTAIRNDEDEVVREFWRLLALCHTVMVEEKDGQLVYQAASPDEEALVTAARNFGYVFLSRTQDTITTNELGVERTYQLLAMMDFNSVRKRMSVLLRDPEGTIRLYTKGADTVIFERLRPGCPNELATEKALDTFAEETLRTLCLASKEVEEEVYQEWNKRHHEASVQLQNRAQAMDKVYEEMEKDLRLLGATAIEDKLQDGVPDTIHLLKKGNIKVWVLTGDKQETAVNIGFACRLLSDDMEILEEKEIYGMLEAYWESNNNLRDAQDSGPRFQRQQSKMALVVTGDFLDKLLLRTGEEQPQTTRKHSWLARLLRPRGVQSAREDPASRRERAFVDLASQCQAVICCRVTPKQKALIVQLVKKYQRVITLAIGDGANDVNMIKTADIGVGISGQEGMQAVQCSDYALAQFCYLQRLLLVHGRWSYLRISKFLRYFFYKTFASMMVQIWFAFYSGFSAQPLYEGWFLALYNIFYTAYPVLSMGLLEQDMSAKKCLEFPELYSVGQKDQLFNYWVFFVALAHGTATSLVNFYVALWAFDDIAGPGGICDYQSFAITVATSALLSVIAEIAMQIKFWTILSIVAVSSSVVLYCLMSFLTQNFTAFRVAPTIFRFPYANQNALTEPYILLVVLLTVVINTMPSLAVRLLCHITAGPEPGKSYQDTRVKVSTVELKGHFQRNSVRRRSSYAFSHKEGYADLIVRGASICGKTPRGPHPKQDTSLCPRTNIKVKESP
uniref:Phospholipid-transporting ATPase n=1 Tax=Sarcophilus harrisii TaxID=9305 RepID=G3WPZ8_SARHA